MPEYETAAQRMSRRSMLADAAKIGLAAIATGTIATVIVRAAGGGKNVAGGPNTITIPFTYSTEKKVWIEAATNDFNTSNQQYNGKSIFVQLDGRGSVDALTKIEGGLIKPVAWCPASMLELNQLTTDWNTSHPGNTILATSKDLAPRSLVSSPLVLATWSDRATILHNHYGMLDWQHLRDALVLKNGWADIGGKPEWGLVKFGQTRPDSSNSGLLAITLMAIASIGQTRLLTLNDVSSPAYVSFLQGFEDAVNMFGTSSGTFLDCAIKQGPANYDVIATYENLALAKIAASGGSAPLTIMYPNPTMVSDHPFAIMNAASPDEQAAARIFRDYLLNEQQQRRSVASGFRPANTNVHINDTSISNNLFTQHLPDIQVNLSSMLAPQPDGTVVNALIELWKQTYQDRPKNPSC